MEHSRWFRGMAGAIGFCTLTVEVGSKLAEASHLSPHTHVETGRQEDRGKAAFYEVGSANVAQTHRAQTGQNGAN